MEFPPPLTRRTRVEAAAQNENCERPADDDPSTRNGEPGTRRTLSTDAASGPTTATQDDVTGIAVPLPGHWLASVIALCRRHV